eukprot:7837332-Prorocentrum_lima.AAC.1
MNAVSVGRVALRRPPAHSTHAINAPWLAMPLLWRLPLQEKGMDGRLPPRTVPPLTQPLELK